MDCYKIDGSKLPGNYMKNAGGLAYRRSMRFSDFDQKSVAPWDSLVWGTQAKDEDWIKVGQCYLPITLFEQQVLTKIDKSEEEKQQKGMTRYRVNGSKAFANVGCFARRTEGLRYHKSPKKSAHDAFNVVPWNSIVWGTPVEGNDDFIQIGDRYLPIHLTGNRVLVEAAAVPGSLTPEAKLDPKAMSGGETMISPMKLDGNKDAVKEDISSLGSVHVEIKRLSEENVSLKKLVENAGKDFVWCRENMDKVLKIVEEHISNPQPVVAKVDKLAPVIADQLPQPNRELEGRLEQLEKSIKESSDGLAKVLLLQTRLETLEQSTNELRAELRNPQQNLLETRFEALEEKTDKLQAESVRAWATLAKASDDGRLNSTLDEQSEDREMPMAAMRSALPAQPVAGDDGQALKALRKRNADLQVELQAAVEKISVFDTRLENLDKISADTVQKISVFDTRLANLDKSSADTMLKVSELSSMDHSRLIYAVQERLEQSERRLETLVAMEDVKEIMNQQLSKQQEEVSSRLNHATKSLTTQINAAVNSLMDEIATRVGSGSTTRLQDIESKLDIWQKQMDNLTNRLPSSPSFQGPVRRDASTEKLGPVVTRQPSPLQGVPLQASTVVRSLSSPTGGAAPKPYVQSRESSPAQFGIKTMPVLPRSTSYTPSREASPAPGTISPQRAAYQLPGTTALPQTVSPGRMIQSSTGRIVSPRSAPISEPLSPRTRPAVYVVTGSQGS